MIKSVPLLFSPAIMPGMLRTEHPKSITTRLDKGQTLPEVGRVMWAKEAFRVRQHTDFSALVRYSDGVERRFSTTPTDWRLPKASEGFGLVSPLLMPRWMTRYSAPLTAVRRERLWAISNAEAEREGLPFVANSDRLCGCDWLAPAFRRLPNARDAFAAWWDHLHPDNPWESNPLVIRYEWDPATADVYRSTDAQERLRAASEKSCP